MLVVVELLTVRLLKHSLACQYHSEDRNTWYFLATQLMKDTETSNRFLLLRMGKVMACLTRGAIKPTLAAEGYTCTSSNCRNG